MSTRALRGKFVVVVGPDGVGKTSLAAELCSRTGGRYFHFRPALRGPWPLPEPGLSQVRATRHASGVMESVLRLGVSWSRFWLGYLLRILPSLRRGAWVVGDRWAYGYVARPRDLRYEGPALLARLAVASLPRPDLVVALVAPAKEIVGRKAELTENEIRTDTTAWLLVPGAVRFDATRTPADLADEILASLPHEPGT